MFSVRIASWNTFSGRHPHDSAIDPDTFASAVAELDADVLALQEVDRAQPRSGGHDLTALAASAMGATWSELLPALVGSPPHWRPAAGDERPDVPAYGVALLSRYPVSARRIVRLPGAPAPVPYRWPGRWMPSLVRDEPRVAVVADVEAPGGRITVVCTHLSFLPVWNGVQLRRLVRSLARDPGPLALLGDLNMGRSRAERITGLAPLVTGPTFPAHAPTRQIDHVLARGVGPATGGPVALPVSDHRALVADL
jgi:endonuclease/exonuclease/phosphatase family metal-dependent hydrolase